MAICRICKADVPLCESHIIPAFVYRWFKATSATGYFRSAAAPNLRLQDGPAPELFCESCERRMCTWEDEFKRTVFDPLVAGNGAAIEYGRDTVMFAASISLRVLILNLEEGAAAKWNGTLYEDVDAARRRWAELLLSENPIAKHSEFHLVPLGTLESVPRADAPVNLNRYLARVIECDIVHTDKESFVHGKLGPVLLLGFMRGGTSDRWEGSALTPAGGHVGKRFAMPEGYMNFLYERAGLVRQAQASMSARQGDRIASAWRRDLDRASESGTFDAMNADVEMFGRRALISFSDPENLNPETPDAGT